MIKAIIVASLLISIVLASNTFSYSFSAQATSTQTRPSYALGTLTAGSTLNITLQIPFPSGDTLSSFVVNIMDSSNANPVQALSFTGTTASNTWNVATTGSYYLQVTTSATTITTVTMYYLSVTMGSTVILRLADVLRQKVFKYFYVSPSHSGGNFVVTITPSAGSTVSLLPMTAGTQFSVSSTTALTPSTTLNGVNTYQLSGLGSGYYGLVFSTDVVVSATITFQGYSYPCPYSSLFADYNAVFMGCQSASTSASSGLPCTSYDYGTLTCLACLSGYQLTNGVCMISTVCGPREYYKFGACYPVSSACGTFDPYTGNCYTCANSSYVLTGSQCIPSNITFCQSGTFLYNSFCIPNNCSAADSNGRCIACASTAYYLANFTCLQINCGNGSYFSTALNNCTALPVGCSNFSTLKQACQGCSPGFFQYNNSCVQPVNSANCQVWNFNTFACAQCNVGYTWNNIICILTIATICSPGQVLINNQCANLPANCLSINIFRICTQCAPGFTIQSGNCVKCSGPNINFPCVTCPLDQFIDSTGACRLASSECGSVNQASGLCNSCKSGASPVGGVCCPSGQSVINGVCMASSSGSSGQAPLNPETNFKEYYRYCLYYNPQQKVCTQCLRGRSFDYADHCA